MSFVLEAAARWRDQGKPHQCTRFGGWNPEFPALDLGMPLSECGFFADSDRPQIPRDLLSYKLHRKHRQLYPYTTIQEPRRRPIIHSQFSIQVAATDGSSDTFRFSQLVGGDPSFHPLWHVGKGITTLYRDRGMT